MVFEDERLIQQLESLWSEKKQLKDHLNTVEATLEQNRIRTDGFAEHEDSNIHRDHLPLFNPLTKNFTLTGERKLRQVFEIFSTEPQVWHYRDYCAYVQRLGGGRRRPSTTRGGYPQLTFDSVESWQMYISDLYESNARGQLTFDGFRLHRVLMEMSTNQEEEEENLSRLKADLLTLGCSWVDPALDQLGRLKQVLELGYVKDMTLNKRDVPSIVYACSGEIVLGKDMARQLELYEWKMKTMRSIRRHKAAMRLFGYPQTSTSDCAQGGHHEEDDATVMTRDGFLAWFFSARPQQRSPRLQALVQSLALSWMYATRNWVLHGLKNMSGVMKRLERVFHQGLLTSAQLVKWAECPAQSKSLHEWTSTVVISSEPNVRMTAAMEVQIVGTSQANAAETLMRMDNITDDPHIRCLAWIDFPTPKSHSESRIRKAIAGITYIVKRYFEPMFHDLPHFRRWTVIVPKTSSGVPVIRLVLLFDQEMDPYLIMMRHGFPPSSRVAHFFHSFEARVQSSVYLSDLFSLVKEDRQTKSKSFNDLASLRMYFKSHHNGKIIRELILHILHQVQDELHEATFFNTILAHSGEAVENPQACSKTWTQAAKELQLQKTTRWMHMMQSLAKCFQTFASLNVTLHFRSIQEWCLGQAWIVRQLPQSFKKWMDTFVSTPRAIPEWYQRLYAQCDAELNDDDDLGKKLVDRPCREALRAIRKSVLGINQMKFEAGTFGLTIDLKGFHFVDFMPEIQLPKDNDPAPDLE